MLSSGVSFRLETAPWKGGGEVSDPGGTLSTNSTLVSFGVETLLRLLGFCRHLLPNCRLYF